MRIVKGDLNAQGPIAIVASQFNELIVENLIKGAKETLIASGLSESLLELFYTSGAVELPLACQKVAQCNRFKGIVAIGTVIRGQTPHFDYVASSCSNGLMQVSLKYDLPIAFGVLTTDNFEQAMERAGCKSGNKGREAAMALIEQINVLEKIND